MNINNLLTKTVKKNWNGSLKNNNIEFLKFFHTNFQNYNQSFSKNNSNPLKLMDLPRTLVSSLIDPFKTRININFNMFLIDQQFRFKEFCKGAQQVRELSK